MYQNLWHEDPINIWVTKSNHSGYFFYDGQCVQYVSHTSYIQWRTGTGWRMHAHDIGFVWSGVQMVDMNSFSELRNDIFCVGQPTTVVRYVPNQLRVFNDGYWTTNWTWNWSGGCSGWLTPYRTAGSW